MNLSFSTASKYRNKKVELDGHIFDSRKEAAVYAELKACQKTGEIDKFEMQKRYELIPAQYAMKDVNGKQRRTCVERAITYLADFVVYYPDGEISVIDAKGMKTDIYRIKRKLMLMVHGLAIKEV
jgi:hypothetical protein